MLLIDQSKLFRTVTRPLAPSATIASEGKAGVASYVNGVLCLSASTGASGEIFAGVMFSSKTPLTIEPWIDTLTVGSTGQVILTNIPIGGSQRVFVLPDTAWTVGIPAAGSPLYSITSNVIQVDPSYSGTVLTIQYQYAPTLAQSRRLQGDERDRPVPAHP